MSDFIILTEDDIPAAKLTKDPNDCNMAGMVENEFVAESTAGLMIVIILVLDRRGFF